MEFGPRALGFNGMLSGTGAAAPGLESQFLLAPPDDPSKIAPTDGPYAWVGDTDVPEFAAPRVKHTKLPGGTLSTLKGQTNLMALTVDDGVSTAVVREYAKFSKRTGMRLTFFMTASYPSWTENATLLRPLVDSGQVQLANHSWSHPNLQKLTDSQIVTELSKTQDFIKNTYGVDARPFFRPPYGNHDARVDKVAASIGYTTPVMWDGTLSDSALIPADTLKSFAKKYVQPERLVLGHANAATVTECFDYISELIKTRQITPVTLNDLYA